VTIGVLVVGGLALLASPAAATFPGQNGRIVFADNGAIVSMNANGSDRRELTTGGINADPAFSASGTRIVYSHTVGKDHVIAVMRADGSRRRALTRRHFDRTPAFSPSGKRIVFSRVLTTPQYQHSELFSVRTDGTHLNQLTHSRPVFQIRHDQPNFSPNGKKIVFEDLLAEQVGVSMIRADGSKAQFHFLDGGIEPSFSPGGQHILFNDYFENLPQLGLVDVAGRHVQTLSDNQDSHFYYSVPNYSPNGKRIVFSSGNDFEGSTIGDIYVMNADGSGLTQITHDGRSLAPDWGPLRGG
jgi:TolB protein